MRIHLVARNMKLSQPLREFVEVKLSKLQEYVENIVWAQVIINVEKKIHTAEVIVHAGHQTMKASAECRPATQSVATTISLRCCVCFIIQVPMGKLDWSVVSMRRKADGMFLPGAVRSRENATGITRGTDWACT